MYDSTRCNAWRWQGQLSAPWGASLWGRAFVAPTAGLRAARRAGAGRRGAVLLRGARRLPPAPPRLRALRVALLAHHQLGVRLELVRPERPAHLVLQRVQQLVVLGLRLLHVALERGPLQEERCGGATVDVAMEVAVTVVVVVEVATVEVVAVVVVAAAVVVT